MRTAEIHQPPRHDGRESLDSESYLFTGAATPAQITTKVHAPGNSSRSDKPERAEQQDTCVTCTNPGPSLGDSGKGGRTPRWPAPEMQLSTRPIYAGLSAGKAGHGQDIPFCTQEAVCVRLLPLDDNISRDIACGDSRPSCRKCAQYCMALIMLSRAQLPRGEHRRYFRNIRNRPLLSAHDLSRRYSGTHALLQHTMLRRAQTLQSVALVQFRRKPAVGGSLPWDTR